MSYIPEKSVVETFGTWKGRIKIKTQDSERELRSDGSQNYYIGLQEELNVLKVEVEDVEGNLTLSMRRFEDRAGVEEEQAEEMLELMKIEYFADPELRLAKKVNEKPEPRRWYWKIKYFVEDYFMLFLSCTCLVFAYLILTR
jgi:hypothetical protein